MNKILWAQVDGFDFRLLDYFSHPFWQHISKNAIKADMRKPKEVAKSEQEAQQQGKISVASSPRLWGEINSGHRPEDNGILGFWEVKLEDGEKYELDKNWNWIKENRCEKYPMYDHYLVPPFWDIVFDNDGTVGLTSVWFTYPLKDKHRDYIDEQGSWILTDFRFPMSHDRMKPDEYVWPKDAHPNGDFIDEVGAGMRVGKLKHEDPVKFYEDILQLDRCRYQYTEKQLKERGTPNICSLYTRAVDGFQHQFRHPRDCEYLEDKGLGDGVENLAKIYNLNMYGIQKLWEAGDFDYLVINSDHGTYVDFSENGKIDNFDGPSDHHWPAYLLIYGEDIDASDKLECRYADVMPTVLDLMGIDFRQYVKEEDSNSIIEQARTMSRLEDLGYLG